MSENTLPSNDQSEKRERTIAPARTIPTAGTLNSVGAALVPPPPLKTERPLPRIDGYDVLAEVGAGGMGVVYKALHLRLKRVVALKMLQPAAGLSTSDWDHLLGRFRREAEALARVRHPNIVEVYDIGETPAGTPYFSLEFCSGGNLDSKLDGKPMPPREAATLIRTLAGAMAAAHKEQVIHRDLKPANILISQEGLYKITDFGLARKLDEVGQTHSGAIFGTPSYMAPEQARGKGHLAGPACDIYSLGAILYECLTGKPPFKAATVLETLQQVIHDEPVPPRQLEPKAPRDLETICLGCLHKDPARRYCDAATLADDLGRFLQGESILARPVGLAERTVRWARKRPAVAGLLALLVLLTLSALTVITLLYRDAVEQAREAQWERAEANKQRDEAARQRDEADKQRQEAIKNFALARQAVDECFLVAKNAPLLQQDGMDSVRKLLLEKALPFYRDFRERRPDDPAIARELAEQHIKVAFITSQIGRKSESIFHYREALALQRMLLNRRPTDEDKANLAETLQQLAGELTETGANKEALSCLEEALSFYKDLSIRRPQDAGCRLHRAYAWNGLARIHNETGKRTEAIRLWREARDELRFLASCLPTDLNIQSHLALVSANLAIAQNKLGLLDDALDSSKVSLRIQRKLAAAWPGQAFFQKELARSCLNHGALLSSLGKSREALELYLEGRAIAHRLVERHPDVGHYQELLSGFGDNLSHLQHSLGRYADALATCREAERLQLALIKKHPDVPIYRRHLALSYRTEGSILRELGQEEEALKRTGEARDLLEKLVKEKPGVEEHLDELARTCTQLGMIQHTLGRLPDALKTLIRARDLRQRLLDRHPDVVADQANLAATLARLAGVQADLEQTAESLEGYRTAIVSFEKLTEKSANLSCYEHLARARKNLAVVLLRGNDRKGALEQLALAHRSMSGLLELYPEVPDYSKSLADICADLGGLLWQMGQKKEALQRRQEAHDLMSALVKSQPTVIGFRDDLATCCLKLAQTSRDGGDPARALIHYREGRDLLLRLVEERPAVSRHQSNLAVAFTETGRLLRHQGQLRAALEDFERAQDLRAQLAKAEPDNAQRRSDLADALNNLAAACADVGRTARALRFYERACKALRELMVSHPGERGYRLALARALANLGPFQQRRGEARSARECCRESVELLRRLARDDPGNARYRSTLAMALYNFGNVLRTQGEHKEALASYSEARDLARALVQAAPADFENRHLLSQAYFNLARTCQDLGQPDATLENYGHAIAVMKKLAADWPDSPPLLRGLVETLFLRGMLLSLSRKYNEAVSDLSEAAKWSDRLLKQSPEDAVAKRFAWSAHYHHAGLLDRVGRYRDALPEWERTVELASDEQRTRSRISRAIGLGRLGRYVEAAAEADDLAEQSHDSANLYDLACVSSLIAAAASRDPARPLPQREKLAETHARRAVALLVRVGKAGFFRNAGNRKLLDEDSALCELRRRDDFRTFQRSLTEKQ